MKHQVDWNKQIYDEFCDLAMLNEFERDVLRLRIHDTSIDDTCAKKRFEKTKINDCVSELKKKYDRVQPLSKHMPVRRKSKRELAKENSNS